MDAPEILVADDEEAVCFVLRRVLEREGFVVHTACDGRTAVAVVRDRGRRVQATFLDVLMPRSSSTGRPSQRATRPGCSTSGISTSTAGPG